MDERKTWQHDFEEISELQLRLLLAKFGWLVDRWGRDYGEDLFVRIFKDGIRTGHDFYIQLKGTDNTKQYQLHTAESLSYSVDLSNLRQWSRLPFPIIFVLWDISGEVGYWLHMQPYIAAIVETKPGWLENQSDAKDPTRNIHIPCNQILIDETVNLLTQEIDQEYAKISLGKQHIEEIQRRQIDNIKDVLQPSLSALLHSSSSDKLPPHVQQQVEIANCQIAVATDPKNLEAWLQLARDYYELGEMDKALVAINKAWELDQTNLQVITARACTLAEYAMLTGQPRSMLYEAIQLFESLKDRAHPATIFYNIGNCYSGLKDYQQAVQNYDQALTANPSPDLAAQIWKNRGTAFYNLQNYDEEEMSYREALRLNPRLWEAYASWGGTKAKRGEFVEASELLAKAFQVNPTLETHGFPQLYWLAYSLASSGNFRDAYLRVNQMLQIKPDSEDGLALKAHILSKLWRIDPIYTESAISFYKERILDNGDDSFARSELYLIYNSEGFDDLQSVLRDSIDLGEVPVQLLYRYALLLESEQKFTQAVMYLENAVKQSQEHHIVHNLARLKKKTGDYQNAIKYYNMALQGVSEPFSILRAMSDCYYFLDDFREAAVTLATSILLGSNETDLWGNLAFALDKLGLERKQIMDFFSYLTRTMLTGVEKSREDIADKLDEMIGRSNQS